MPLYEDERTGTPALYTYVYRPKTGARSRTIPYIILELKHLKIYPLIIPVG